MTRRILVLVVALAMVLPALPAVAIAAEETTSASSRGKGLDYDLERVRAAQASAAEQVGQPPADVSAFFEQQPAHLVHPRQDDYDLPKVLHASIDDLPLMQERMRAYLATRYRTQAAAAQEAGEPMVFKVPVLMFGIHGDEWQEESTPDHFEDQLSGVGTSETGTVTEMYLEQSFGNMVVDFDVYGPYDESVSNAPGNQCHYGTEGAPVTGDVLGLGGLGARGMAVEAVPQADPDVDFGEYDNDLDGTVDFLLMLHSGPDAAATGDPCHVWSHYFGSIGGEPTVGTSDTNSEGQPVVVGPVMTVPEIDLEIGVTAHELMHALGEPDYYGTAGTAGTGDWDLGAGGSWGGIPAQTNPVHFNPVMKINFGWIDPERIDGTALDRALRPRASYPDLLQVPLQVAAPDSEEADLCDQAPVGVPGQNNAFYTDDGSCLVEGFLIENVNAASAAVQDSCTVDSADFDRQLYGSGLMVWHWDFTNYEQLGNNNIMRPMLDIEEFDRRDDLQDLSADVSRGHPLDVFWGDPVGISGATQAPPGGEAPESPEDSPWTVTSPPTGGAAEAEPVPEWDAADAPEGTAMVVELSWDVPTDDWDLAVDRLVDDEWVEVGESASGAPQTSEQVTVTSFEAGERFRARAYNWLAADAQAEVSVTYDASARTTLGTAGTRNNDLEQTGWALTNLRPNDYRGLAHEAAQPDTPITLDVVKHDDSTVDVSPDFLRAVQDSPGPVTAGSAVPMMTRVYNHGGKATTATVQVHDGDPADGGASLGTETVQLEGFSRDEVTFDVPLAEGLNDLYVTASADGDTTPGNDVVRSEVNAWDGDGDVLIVDNDFGWTREQAHVATLSSLGVSFDVVEGVPSAETMQAYDAVIWVTTTVSGGNGVMPAEDQDTIAAFLDGGGKLWMDTTRVAAYAEPEWLASYFGFVPDQNLLNSMGTLKGSGDAIGGSRETEVGYLDGRPYWDYGTLAEGEDVKGTVTQLFTHSERDDRAFVTKVEGTDGFRSVYGLPIGLLDDTGERVTLTSEILSFLGVETGGAAAETPTVAFERFQHVQVGQDWPVTVGAVAPGGVDEVALVHRPYGGEVWRTLTLDEAADGMFGGTIPGAQIGNNGLEYFVRAVVDGETVTLDGGQRMPNVASAPYGDPLTDGRCAAECNAAQVPDSGFTDTAGNTHELNIECIAWYGITVGTTATTYSPARPTTRGQMASYIARLAVEGGLTLPANPRDAFSDDDRDVHEDNINALAEMGLVKGKTARQFDPKGRVTRAQMASFIANVHEAAVGSLPTASDDHFPDDNGNTHEANINSLAELGVVRGRSGRYFPGERVSRAQMASFVMQDLGLQIAADVAYFGGAAVTLESAAAPAGGELAGAVASNKRVASLVADGCGRDSETVEVDGEGAFTVQIGAEESGSCELELTVTTRRPGARDDTQTVTYAFTVAVAEESG